MGGEKWKMHAQEAFKDMYEALGDMMDPDYQYCEATIQITMMNFLTAFMTANDIHTIDDMCMKQSQEVMSHSHKRHTADKEMCRIIKHGSKEDMHEMFNHISLLLEYLQAASPTKYEELVTGLKSIAM